MSSIFLVVFLSLHSFSFLLHFKWIRHLYFKLSLGIDFPHHFTEHFCGCKRKKLTIHTYISFAVLHRVPAQKSGSYLLQNIQLLFLLSILALLIYIVIKTYIVAVDLSSLKHNWFLDCFKRELCQVIYIITKMHCRASWSMNVQIWGVLKYIIYQKAEMGHTL